MLSLALDAKSTVCVRNGGNQPYCTTGMAVTPFHILHFLVYSTHKSIIYSALWPASQIISTLCYTVCV